MADLLVGLCAGLVAMGSAWAWFELRRDHRRLMADHADLRAAVTTLELAQRSTALALNEHRDAIYDHNADLETLEQRFGYGRYKRGGEG